MAITTKNRSFTGRWADHGQRRGRTIGGILAAFVVILAVGPIDAADAQGSSQIRTDLERIVNAYDIQRDLPAFGSRSSAGMTGNPAPGGTLPADRPEAESGSGGENEDRALQLRKTIDLGSIGDPGPVLQVLLWVLIGALAIVVVHHLARSLRQSVLSRRNPEAPLRTPPARQSKPKHEGGPPDELPADPLAEAETLARAGRHDEAVHLILLLALERFQKHFGEFRRSRTSLELVQSLPLDERALAGLSELVAAVQQSRFGGRVLGETDYRRCIESFHIATGRHGATA